jgi:hypothetical protein
MALNIIRPSRDTYKISNYFSARYIEQTEPGRKKGRYTPKG